VKDWAQIRWLRRAEGVSISAIAPRMGISPNTVRAALAWDRLPKYMRVPRPRLADWGRGTGAGAAGGVPADAGDGDKAGPHASAEQGRTAPMTTIDRCEIVYITRSAPDCRLGDEDI